MKKRLLTLSIITLSIITLLLSCSDNNNLQFVDQEIIDGKISNITEGIHAGGYGVFPEQPKIYVQTPTQTREVEIPFEYDGKWKVGDSCLLIVQRYKQVVSQ